MKKQPEVTERTRKKIVDTFWNLLEEMSLSKITVKLISQTANINRSTFYQYFDDINMLVDYIEKGIIDDLEERIPDVQEIVHSILNENEKMIRYTLHLMSKTNPRILVLLDSGGDPHFIDRIREIAYQRYRESFPQKEEKVENEYYFQIVFSMIIQTNLYWYRHQNIPYEEMVKMICNVLVHGISTK